MIFYIITIIFLFHWIGDFILQSDWMAKNKSSNHVALLNHVSVYGFALLFSCLLIPITITWVIFNVFAHFCTDFITSRITKKLWEKKDVHNFFVVIGFDQLVHALTLIWSYYFMVLA